MDKKNLAIYIMMLGTFGILSTELGMIGIIPQAAEHFHVNLAEAGLLVSLFSLTIAICALFMPVLFSKFERRRTFSFVLLIFVICTALSAFVEDFKIALLLRIIPAIVHPVYCSISLTVAGEIVPEAEAQSAISKIIMGVSAGMILGVPLITLICSYFGYSNSMLFCSFINLVSLILTLIFFPTTHGEKQSYKSQLSVAKEGIVIISALGVIALNGALYCGYGYIAEFLRQMVGIVGLELTIVLFIYGMASIVGNWVGSKLLINNANKTTLIFPFVMIVLFLLFFVVCRSIIATVIIMAIWGLFNGINNDISQYWMLSSAPSSPEFANGLFISMGNVGVTIGTTIAGFVIIGSDVHNTLLLAASAMIIAFIIIFARVKNYPNT